MKSSENFFLVAKEPNLGKSDLAGKNQSVQVAKGKGRTFAGHGQRYLSYYNKESKTLMFKN